MSIASRQSLWTNHIKQWPYVDGTNLMLKIPSNGLTLTLGNCAKDASSSQVVIDWGDGSQNTYTASSFAPSHTYAAAGLYVMNISDDISSLMYKGTNTGSTVYMMFSFGTKLLTLQGQCFQNCGYNYNSWSQQELDEYFPLMKDTFRDHIVDAYFTSMGNYACDGFRCPNLHFASMTSITGIMFYASGLNHVQNLYFSNIASNGINGNYLLDWSSFMNGFTEAPTAYYDQKSITFYNKTCAQIKAMSQFPWKATDVSVPVYFHGTDGTIDKYGNPV